MNTFKNYLNENSFYSLQKEKDAFLDNDKLIVNAFFFAFIMPLGFLDSAKVNDKVKVYFRNDKKLRIDNIGDENNDSSLIIKIMADKGFFKTTRTPNEITRFLVKVRSGQIDSIDENILRAWIGEIRPDKLIGSSAVVKKLTKEFLDGGSLATFADALKSNSKVTRWKDTEFYTIAKALKIDPAKKKSAPSTTATSVEPDQKDTSVKTGVPDSDTVQKPPSRSTANVSTPKPVGKLPWADSSTMMNEFRSGADIDSKYKHTGKNREDFLAVVIKSYKDDVIDDKLLSSVVSFIKKFPYSQNTVQQLIFSDVKTSSYSYRYRDPSSSFLKLVRSDIMDLLDKGTANKSVKDYISSTITSIIRQMDNVNNVKEIEDIKNSYQKFIQSNIVQNNLDKIIKYRYGQTEKMFEEFLFSISDEDFLERLVKRAIIIKTPSGSYTFDYNTSSISIMKDLLRSKGVKQPSQIEIIIDVIDRNNKMPWGSMRTMTPEERKEFTEYLDKLSIEKYNQYAIKGLKAADDLTEAWQYYLLKQFLERIEIITLLTNSIGRSSIYSSIRIDQMPSNFIKIALDRMFSYLKNRSIVEVFKDSTFSNAIDNLYDLAEKAGVVNQYKDILAKAYYDGVKELINLRSRNRYMYISGSITKSSTETNPLRDLLSKEQIEEIDELLINQAYKQNTGISGSVSKYSNLSDKNKELVKRILDDPTKDGGLAMLRQILDTGFFTSMKYEEVKRYVGNPLTLTGMLPEDSKKSVLTNLLKDKRYQADVENAFTDLKNNRSYGSDRNVATLLQTLVESGDIDVKFVNNVSGSLITYLENRKDFNSYSGIVSYLNRQENFNNKSKVVYEKFLLSADENMNKLKTEYRDFMSAAQEQFMSYVENDKKGAEYLYQKTSKSMKRRLAAQYMNMSDFSSSAKEAMSNPNTPIRPFEKLTDKRVKEILRYNNVVSEETKIPDKHIRDFVSMDMYLRTEAKNRKPLEDLKVEELKLTSKELNQLTADLHRTKRNERHGTAGMVIKKSFNVSIPMQVKSQKEWIEKDPTQQIINPMYHGTGSVAASMILRYGFRVIKSGDSSVVGRMLGDGVYGAIHIDKSQQYVGDSGFSRAIGTKGYIFEMNAALGQEGKDYRAAGVGGRDNIRSPEWCVFTPNSQFLIFKAHEVEIASESVMRTILSENPPANPVREQRENNLKFKSYLKEYVMEEPTNYTTYTFINGLIPTGNDNMVDFEDFKSPDPERITLEPSAFGPSIVIQGTRESNDYMFTGPSDFRVNFPELFEEYLDLMQKK